MASFNRVTLMGNLTRDPATKYLPKQIAVCEFGIAMNRKYKTASGEDREDVVFVDCAAFDKLAERIQKYYVKGNPIHFEGRLKFNQWEDKQTGGKRSKLSVVVETLQFLPLNERGEQSSSGPAPATRPAPPQAGQYQSPPLGEGEFKDDDIPF